jgi:putative intracellular protease/amidase
MPKSILLVLTSHGSADGKDTGWFLPELAHPFFHFKNAGFDLKIVSIKGGNTTVAPSSLDMTDEENKLFWESPEYKSLTENTETLESCDSSNYDCVFFVGGFGTMFDFPFDSAVNKMGREVYEKGGVVSAVCHGPIALANITLSNGDCIVKGKAVCGFTNEEEAAVGLLDILPLHEGLGKSCEDVLTAKGGLYEKTGAWGVKVCSQDRLVTGQNPASARSCAEAVVAALL